MIISVVPELALDDGTPFAGGLGVLEADKFYTCARNFVEYTSLHLYILLVMLNMTF